MMLQVKVIWHLLNLCAIAFAWNVQGSTGFSVFASNDPFSSFTSVEEQNHGYTPSAAPFLNGSFVQPPNIHPTVSSNQSAVTPSSTIPFHAQQSAASPKPNPASGTLPLPPVNPPSTTYHGSSPAIPPSTTSLSPPSVAAMAPKQDQTPEDLPSPSPLLQIMPSAVPSHDSWFSPTSSHDVFTPPRNLVPSQSLAPQPPSAIPPVTTTSPVSAQSPPSAIPPIKTTSPVSAQSPPSAIPPITTPSPVSAQSPPSATLPITTPSPVSALPPRSAIPPITTPSPVSAQSPPSATLPITTPSPVSALPPPSARLPITTESPVSSQPPRAALPPITTPFPVLAPPPKSTLSDHHPPHQYPLPLPAPIDLSPSPVTKHSSQSLSPIPPLHAVPPVSLIPPPDAAPVRDVAPSSPAESHFSAPPPHSSTPPIATPFPVSATASPVSAPPPRSATPPITTASPVSAPPPRSATPPIATESPVSASPPRSAIPAIVTASPVSAPPPRSATPPITTPSPVSAPPPNFTVSNHHLLPLPAHIDLSPSPEAAPSHDLAPPPNSTIPEQSAPEAAAVHDVAPSSPAESHFSAPPPNATNQPPDAVPPTDSATPSHNVASSPPTESHFSAPPPSDAVPPTVPLPPLDAAPPSHIVASSPPTESHFSAPPPSDAVSPTVPLPPLDAAPPSHIVASSPPTESHFSAPPPTLPLPPLDAAPPSHDVASSPPTAPHFTAPPPSDAVPPSHDVASSPPTAPHFTASPPTPSIHAPNSPPDAVPPTVPSPPPNAAPPSRDVASSPPTESHFPAPPPNPLIQAPNPPPYAVSPTVSSPPPLHDVASAPPTNPPAGSVSLPPPHAAPSHELAPSPTFVSNFSAPPTSGSVKPSHSSPPSTTAEPPLTASPPIIHTLPPAISNSSAPLAAPPVRPPSVIPVLPTEPPSIAPEAQLPRVSSPAPSIGQRGDPVPVAPSGPIYPLSPTNHHPEQGFSPSTAPSIHKSKGLPISPTAETAYSPSLSPLPSIDPTHNRSQSNHSSPETSYTVPPSPSPKQQGHTSLAPAPTSHNPGSSAAVAPAQSPLIEDYISPVPMSTVPVTPGHSLTPFISPEISPSTSEPIIVLAPPMLALPPPPPNQDCLSYTCLDPYTNTIPGSPCGCVLPMRVELRIGVALYTFFPLVPEFAREIATAIFMKQSQVRVMGANAASDKPDKTLLLIDLVPLNDKFDNITALLIFERFWNHQVDISKTLFGDYQVLYVQYPGLPASPPMAPSDIAAINGGPYPGENGSKINPLGVDVTKQRHKHKLSGSLIAIIAFSAVGALLLFLLLGWILLFRHRRQRDQSAEAANVHPSSIARSTGPTGQSAGSRPSFSLSFESSVAAYNGSAKTFSAAEIERATDNFNPSRVLGEGGFGLVYSATLEDNAEVAVKVLKREDQQGGREFLAEIEMLSRLHHRNLVKLIGICAEEHIHCLIYELIPNGSVESHLHGIDKKTSPLDWSSRLKIALGAARGLAYLHEDSSPRVIHRDFKASNILLEADFTPKVSDFGLARTAMDEDNKHISTRVMGTFGYVAPEYAMTGHLLVKSDVYSYGVVLLELLTGRKPVDMSQPSGQENLVAWTRPYLTTKEALKSIIDPNLGPYISFESVAKVAAIASMCVQPEVSHRPFMGEVVQALKLVCNECDDSREDSSGSTGSENEYRETRDMDVEKALSVSDVFCKDSGLSESFRRGSSSGPIGGGRSWRFWKRGGTASSREDGGENGVYRFWSGSH